MAASSELGVIDRGLAGDDAELAARAVLMPTLDARLVMIEVADGVDKFHVLQGIEDPELPDGPERFFIFQRWGETGGRGASSLEGPMLAPKVEGMIRAIFEEKTGYKWGEVEAGHDAKAGKYWLQAVAKSEADARWEYYVSDGVDGKAPGWYPYETNATVEMEELYAQHVGNGCNERTATRNIKSGYFSYTVDLSGMIQTNTKTRTQRDIRRVFGREEGGDEAKPGRPVVKKADLPKAMKAMKAMVARLPPKRLARLAAKESASSASLKRSGSSGSLLKKSASSSGLAMKKAVIPMKGVKKAKAPKAMKVMKAKVMKAPKPKKTKKTTSTVAKKGKMALFFVMSGKKVKTAGGLRKDDLEKNKWGKIVPKRKSASQKKNTWMIATREAMKALGKTGFVPCGGPTAEGKALYKKAKEIHATMK